MLSRKDRENLYLAVSDDVSFWNEATELDKPAAAWELLQIGNCGSPLETRAGWLVLTPRGGGDETLHHRGDAARSRGSPAGGGTPALSLLEPDETEREGYVPNVVYSCGGSLNGDDLVLPYGQADGAVGVAWCRCRS
jgi:predicted GH43/DUF377 family glycosyl hydrolase